MDECKDFDITGKVGPLWPRAKEAEIPMYSFERPAYILWNAIGKSLCAKGWSEKKIAEWLQSKGPRWALDGSLGDAIEKLGADYAEQAFKEYT